MRLLFFLLLPITLTTSLLQPPPSAYLCPRSPPDDDTKTCCQCPPPPPADDNAALKVTHADVAIPLTDRAAAAAAAARSKVWQPPVVTPRRIHKHVEPADFVDAWKWGLRRAWQKVLQYDNPLHEWECPTTSQYDYRIVDYTVEPRGRAWQDFKDFTEQLRSGETKLIDIETVHRRCRQGLAKIEEGLGFFQRLWNDFVVTPMRRVVVDLVFGSIRCLVGWLQDMATASVGTLRDSIVFLVKSSWAVVTTFVHFVVQSILLVLQTCVNIVLGLLTAVISFVISLVRDGVRSVVGTILDTRDTLVAAAMAMVAGVRDGWFALVTAVRDFGLEVTFTIQAGFVQMWTTIVVTVTDAVTAVQQQVRPLEQAVTNIVGGGIATSTKSVVSGISAGVGMVFFFAGSMVLPWCIAFLSTVWGLAMWRRAHRAGARAAAGGELGEEERDVAGVRRREREEKEEEAEEVVGPPTMVAAFRRVQPAEVEEKKEEEEEVELQVPFHALPSPSGQPAGPTVPAPAVVGRRRRDEDLFISHTMERIIRVRSPPRRRAETKEEEDEGEEEEEIMVVERHQQQQEMHHRGGLFLSGPAAAAAVSPPHPRRRLEELTEFGTEVGEGTAAAAAAAGAGEGTFLLPPFPESFSMPLICAVLRLAHPDIAPLREGVGRDLWDEAVEVYRRDLFETRGLDEDTEIARLQPQPDGRYQLPTHAILHLTYSPDSRVPRRFLFELYEAVIRHEQNNQT